MIKWYNVPGAIGRAPGTLIPIYKKISKKRQLHRGEIKKIQGSTMTPQDFNLSMKDKRLHWTDGTHPRTDYMRQFLLHTSYQRC